MDLTTTYLGLRLTNPVVPGASPLADELDTVRRLEDAGAPAVILRSLFEEQIALESMDEHAHVDAHGESFAEAASYFPSAGVFQLRADQYLEHLRAIKEAVQIPVIGSLNGTTPGGWLSYAKQIKQAGADALELNVYRLATDLQTRGSDLERQILEIVHELKRAVAMPIAVKLSSSYTSLANFAWELDQAGADGLVLFNRFYQPDIDVEELSVARTIHLSTSSELLPRLHWVGILSGRVRPSLAVTGGVHTALDVVKATMAGAHVAQMVSALLAHGPTYLQRVLADLRQWMEEHEWASLGAMRGNLSLKKVPDPAAYERANYMMLLQSWRGAYMQGR
ncbi:MAG: dihydroorotate dehydrogenase-like protein [Vicinamibacterales bacterium]